MLGRFAMVVLRVKALIVLGALALALLLLMLGCVHKETPVHVVTIPSATVTINGRAVTIPDIYCETDGKQWFFLGDDNMIGMGDSCTAAFNDWNHEKPQPKPFWGNI